MKKQYSVPLVLFLLGMAITIIDSLFKLMHWPGANIMLTMNVRRSNCFNKSYCYSF